MDKEADDLIRWIKASLKQSNRRQADLARHLELPASRMSEIMHGRRRLTGIELQQVSSFFGRPVPGVGTSRAEPLHMPVVGTINTSWSEIAADAPSSNDGWVGTLLDSETKPQFQVAYRCEINDRTHDLRIGDMLLCGKVGHAAAKPGRLVIVERKINGGLINLSYGEITQEKPLAFSLAGKPVAGAHTARAVAIVLAIQRPR